MCCHKMVKTMVLIWVAAVACCWTYPLISWSEGPSGESIDVTSGFYHTVEKGDTLWYISEDAFDSPWLWPELWGENSHITNPHRIEPGDRIRLFSRQGVETVVEHKPEPEVVSEEAAEPPCYYYPPVEGVGFVSEKPEEALGTISDVKGDKEMVSYGDVVYIQPAANKGFREGQRYTVFRLVGRLKGPDEGKDAAIQHRIVGIVEIAGVQPELCVGRVVRSFREIELNDSLMPYEERSPKIVLAESPKGLEGRIIASEEHQIVFGDNTVVFLDKGYRDGVRAGQSYNIYYQEKGSPVSWNKDDVFLPPVDYGQILILRSEYAFATALVTSAEKMIEAGARIRTPGD